ncbi:hypothetical protein [Amycolatopsis sp. NPDC004378]
MRRTAATAVLTAICALAAAVAAGPAEAGEYSCELNNVTLSPGDLVRSCNGGAYILYFQEDGNLVLRNSSGDALWSTGTEGKGVDRAVMQQDGNFVLYAGSDAKYATGTGGYTGASIRVQEDGNLVVYANGTAEWDRYSGLLGVFSENTRPQDGTNCEPAFVVQNFSGEGSIGIISAGHCDTKGKSAATVYGNQDFEIVPVDINKLNAPTVVGGKELRSANFFRAGWRDGDVFVSDNRDNTVNPKAIGAIGNQVCHYGGVSASACGNIIRDDYSPTYVQNSYGFYLLDIKCAPGDSGSAVLSADGTRAVGIVSGRRVRDGACVVSRLDKVYPGMSLYQPPALDAKYQLYFLDHGKWYAIGQPEASRDKCLAVATKGGYKNVDIRCVAV